jgi:16S rRNA (cytosine967-C5)-methyltransferase
MNSKGTVVASDIRTHKFDDLRRRARRAGLSNIRTKEWKGKALPKKMTGYDGVLVDAPCSCSGTWRRNPDARWTTQRADVIELAELQLSLLTNAATAVRKDGTLVYATCSMFTRENDHVVQTFLRENQQFQLDPFKNPLDGTLTDGTLQIWPWDSDCDAMFVARMKRMH